MSPDQVLAAAPNIALALLGIAALLMLVSFRLFRRSRTDSFWRRRRAAGQQGFRVFVVSGIMLIFSGAICAISTFGPRLLNRATTPTEAVAIAPTDDLTLTAIFVPTQPLQPTQPETPSSTSTILIPTETETATEQPSDTPIPPTETDPPSPTYTSTPAPTETATDNPTETPDVQLTVNAAAQVPSEEPPTATFTFTLTLTLTDLPPTATDTATIVPTTAVPPTATFTSTASATSTYTLTPEPTITPTPITPTATETPTPTDTPTVLPTETPTQTPTITPTLIPIFQPPQLTSSVTPSAKSKMTIVAITSRITADLKPVEPSLELPIGITRVYFFVDFSDMQPGVLWRRELRNDDDIVMSNTYLWGQTQTGTTFFYFGQPSGFAAGNYEIRLYLGSGDQPIATAAFNVK